MPDITQIRTEMDGVELIILFVPPSQADIDHYAVRVQSVERTPVEYSADACRECNGWLRTSWIGTPNCKAPCPPLGELVDNLKRDVAEEVREAAERMAEEEAKAKALRERARLQDREMAAYIAKNGA